MACGRGPARTLGSCWQVEEGQWMSLVGTWWELGRSEITDANLFFASSLTLLKLLFYESVVEGRSPFGRILVPFHVAKLALVGLHVVVHHVFLPIVEIVHEGVAPSILSVHMHFGQRQ